MEGWRWASAVASALTRPVVLRPVVGRNPAACVEELSLAQGPPLPKPGVRVPGSQHSEHMLAVPRGRGCVSWGLSGHRVVWVSASTFSTAWLE